MRTTTRRPAAIRGKATRVLLVLGGFLIGGLAGAVIAVLALAALDRRSARSIAGAAVALLALAALSTVVEHAPSRLTGTTFATARPLAAALGEATAILLMVAVVGFLSEREERHPLVDAPAPAPRLPALVRDLPAVVGVLATALAVRLIAAPTPIPPGYSAIIDNLRNGVGYRNGVGFASAPTAFHPPATGVIAAFSPIALDAVLILASVATVAVVMRLALRLSGWSAALPAGVAAALLPAVWGQQLPETLAALGVIGGVAWAVPAALTPGRALLAGAAFAGAALARPEALLAVPVVCAWIAVTRKHGEHFQRRALAPSTMPIGTLLVAAAAVMLPWLLWAHTNVGSWLPTTNLGATLSGATTERTQRGTLIGSFDLGGVFGPDGPLERGGEVAADHAYRRRAGEHLEAARVPMTVVARVLRGWDLWSPSSNAAARQARGLPLPGGALGGITEMAATVGLAAFLVLARRRWRLLLPLFAFPLAFTLESAVLFGDRGLRGWIAPVVAVALGVAVSELRTAIRARRPVSTVMEL